MVRQCSMVISWPSNTLMVLTPPGCIALAATFILTAAAIPANRRAPVRTVSLASRSSNSCETWTFWLVKFQSIIQFNLRLVPLWLKALWHISVIVMELYTLCLGCTKRLFESPRMTFFATQAQGHVSSLTLWQASFQKLSHTWLSVAS